MTPCPIVHPVRLRWALVLALASSGLLAQAAGPKSGQPAVLATPTASVPVERLIIQYKPVAKQAGPATAATGGDERAAAAALVSHSAGLARVQGLRYLKSVSPQLHVAQLERALPPGEAQALMARLRVDPAVASVTVDQRVRPHALPTDAYFSNAGSDYYQWHLQAPVTVPGGINAAAAWDRSSGANVRVAVLDGGYRPHPDLAANLLTTSDFDFVSADSDSRFWTANDGDGRDANAEDPGDWVTAADATASCEASDSSWHGTHVTGLIGALANSSEGVGVAFGARVLPVRVLGRCGGYLSDIQAGMRWAAGLSVDGVANTTTPAQVLNLSLGIDGGCDAATQAVIDEVRDQGVSVVASAGNGGVTVITQPANCMGVVAMTAHTRSGANAGYANVGPGVALSAPGGDLADPMASTWNLGTTVPAGDSYGRMYGTSMAAPQAAGVLALMASARTDLKQGTLEALMRGAVRPFPAGTYCATNPDGLPPGFCGSGLLDAGLAVAAAQAVPEGLADLEVLQRATASSWEPGTLVTLSIQLRNWGATTATAVQLGATLTGLEILSVSSNLAGVVPTLGSTGLNAAVGNLAAGAELVLTVNARVTASDGAVSSAAEATGGAAEATLVNNKHRLDPEGLVSDVTPVPPPTDSGGGCTVAPAGQADVGLPLLAAVAALVLLWRRREPVSAAPR